MGEEDLKMIHGYNIPGSILYHRYRYSQIVKENNEMPSPKLKHSNLVNLPLVSYSSELGECVTQIYVEPYRISGTIDGVYNMICKEDGDDQSS